MSPHQHPLPGCGQGELVWLFCLAPGGPNGHEEKPSERKTEAKAKSPEPRQVARKKAEADRKSAQSKRAAQEKRGKEATAAEKAIEEALRRTVEARTESRSNAQLKERKPKSLDPGLSLDLNLFSLSPGASKSSSRDLLQRLADGPDP